MRHLHKSGSFRPGFTLMELLVSSTIMLVVIISAMYLYMESNKITVDQQQYADLQHNIRSSMFFVSRDIRSAGVGLPEEFMGYFLEGQDNDSSQSGAVTPDRLKIMGNIEDPLNLSIDSYQGSAVNISLEDSSFEQYHYLDDYYDDKFIMILPNPDSGCRMGEIRVVTHVTHDAGGTNERLNFSPGLAPDINPPGGLSGSCPESDDYDGGTVTFIEVKEYWLDVDGNYPGLTAGDNGYIGGGEGGIFYMTQNAFHYPIAQNVENLQFEYNGDFDNDGFLDGYQPWNSAWTGDPLMASCVHQVRILILGRTPDHSLSVSGTPPTGLFVYRRPALSNTAAASSDDMHRRFMLESTANVRNLSLYIYNTGVR